MLKKGAYFISGIGTDIGKTYLVENLCRFYKSSNAIKPIASGFIAGDPTSDPAKILAALGLTNSKENINSITPWRFEEALSPHFAAKNNNTKIDFSEVKNFCQEKILQSEKDDEFLFIEAAGGVMTPINDEKTFLDLAQELKIPTLLVAADYLGAISHTLCSVESLKSRNVEIINIVINKSAPISTTSDFSMRESVEKLSCIKTVFLHDLIKPS